MSKHHVIKYMQKEEKEKKMMWMNMCINISRDKAQEFAITILPMDDGTPVISVNAGLQFLEQDEGRVRDC